MILQKLLGIELPIIQAPMAGVQGSALAVAVSNAGGLGSLPCALLDADAMRKELAAIRAATPKPFNVNFFCHAPPEPDAEREAAWRATLAPYFAELGIDAGTRSPPGPARAVRRRGRRCAGGIPARRGELPLRSAGAGPARARARWGAKILSSATTVEEARWLEARGVDAVIAQGLEAGGHRGIFLSDDLGTQLGTFALVPQIVRAVKIPVIAAGGIADATASRRDGARRGRRAGRHGLHAVPRSHDERGASRGAQERRGRATAITNLFTGRPRADREPPDAGARADQRGRPAFPLAAAALAPLRAKAESQGCGDFSPLWAGQNTSGCSEVSAA